MTCSPPQWTGTRSEEDIDGIKIYTVNSPIQGVHMAHVIALNCHLPPGLAEIKSSIVIYCHLTAINATINDETRVLGGL